MPRGGGRELTRFWGYHEHQQFSTSASKTSASELNLDWMIPSSMLEVLILYIFYIPASLVFNLGWIGGGFHPACWKFTKAFWEQWPRLLLIHGNLSVLEIKQHVIIEYMSSLSLAVHSLYSYIQLIADWALGVHCAPSSCCTLWTSFQWKFAYLCIILLRIWCLSTSNWAHQTVK